MKQYKTILFDFDGTLVDSAPGIMLTLNMMMREMGRETLSDEELRACVGPPIHQFFPELLNFHGEEMQKAIDLYRRIFDEKALATLKVFPGMIDLLRDIKAAGFLTGIATCKLKGVCEKQADTLGISPYIDYVSGAVPEKGIFEKADVIRAALDELGALPEDTLMVGDRIFDLIGANEAGTDGLGIMLGGCETREELLKHEPVAIVEDAAELRSYILG